MRQRVWEAAHVKLRDVTLDTDTTIHTRFGQQMGIRKGYNPKNRGKKSHQPILTFLAETREYVGGELRNGDRPTGQQIARHLGSVFAALPETVQTIRARADSGFYCREAVEAYEQRGCHFIISVRKTSRLVDAVRAAHWTGSPRTDADGQCEFAISRRDGPKRIVLWRCLPQEAQRGEDGTARTIPVVRHAGLQLSRFRHQHRGTHRRFGVVLQSAGRGREPDQGSQQRCGTGGPSVGALGHELHSFSTGDVGLQLELLAPALQSRGAGQGGSSAAHDLGHEPAVLSLSGGQDLATCRPGGSQLQRSLCRTGYLSTSDEPAARHRGGTARICSGHRCRAPVVNMERA